MLTGKEAALHAPVKRLKTGLQTLTIIARPLSLDAASFWYIGLILRHVHFQPLLFRCLEANEWRVEELLSLMPVCKQWCSEIRRVVVDVHWLQALRSYGASFVSELPLVVENMTSSDCELHSYNTTLGTIERFYGKMRATMWDVTTQAKALEAMGIIVQNVLMHNYGDRAVCMVRAVMSTHVHCGLIQKQGCRAMASITLYLDDGCNRCAQGSMIPRIVEVLRRFGSDTETAKQAVLALYRIMRKHRVNRGLVVAAGAVPFVLRMMRLHEDAAFFQTSASFLSNMAYNGFVVEDDVRDLVYQRMAMLPEDAGVQSSGTRVLAMCVDGLGRGV